ncbi:MAG: Ig-like domain-containing protein [Lachnospiraceae bacterium]|nr:Ig-like domain-containing protein [Lachnospiraceae bacterium]
MKQKKKLGRKILSALLTLVLVLSLMPGMSLTAYALESAEANGGWTDFFPETGEYVLVCSTDPSKVLLYDYGFKFGAFTGADSQKWHIQREEGKPYYRITFGDHAMDVPAWEQHMNYGDNLSSVSYSSYSAFSENETNVFRFSKRTDATGKDTFVIRVVSEAQNKLDYVLQGNVTGGGVTVQKYSDDNTAQQWSFVGVEEYSGHEHHFTYADSGNTVTATCDNDAGICLLANRQAVLKITPPTNLAQGGSSSDADKQAQLTGKDGKVFTDSNTSAISYYAATLNGTTYTKKDTALAGAPTTVGDYVAEVTVTVNGQTYTASIGYSLLDLTVIGTDSGNNIYLPTYTNYNYAWSQQIYTKNEVGKSGNILAVDFFNAGNQKMRNLEVYMVETDKDSFNGGNDWVSISTNNKVFSGNVTFTPNVWTSIVLDTPYVYSGTKNLLLCVRDMTGSYNGSMSCRVSNANQKAIYVYRDDGSYDISNPGVNGTVLDIRNNIRLAIVEAESTIIPESVTAQLKEGETIIYNGSPQTPAITVKNGDEELNETDYTVEYVGVSPTEYGPSSTAPTNAGSYKAVITFKNYTGSKEVEFTIDKAPALDKSSLTDNQKPKGKEGLTYTGDEQLLVTAQTELPAGYDKVQYSTDGGETWSDKISAGTDASDYTIKVRYSDSKGNRESFDADDIMVTISKGAQEKPDAASFTVKNASDAVTKDGEISGADDTMQYSTDDGETWNDAVKDSPITGLPAGDVLVRYKETANLNASEAVTINVKNQLEEDNTEAVNSVRALINAIPDDPTTEDGRKAVEDARKAYEDNLTEDQKKLIGDDTLKKLTDAENAIAKADLDKALTEAENKQKEEDEKKANAVTDAINKLPASNKVTIADKAAIESARKAYTDLTADQRKKVSADILKKLTDAETALAAAEKKAAEDEAAKKKEEADKAAANKAAGVINALPVASKIAATDKASIGEARKVYNSLTADQKKKVSADTLKKLTDAEAALAATEKEAAATVAKKNELSINEAFKVTQKDSKITVKWGKVEGATGYEVYVAYCGKSFSKTPAKRTTTMTSAVVTKIGGKKINLKRNFKVYVVAVKKEGGKTIRLAKSITGHIVGSKNTKYTNVKSITLKTKTLSIAIGKTSKIKAKAVLVDKSKKQLGNGHAAEFRYASSDKSIATVDKNGKVTGVSAGTTTVYVYARNGLAKAVKVTVK